MRYSPRRFLGLSMSATVFVVLLLLQLYGSHAQQSASGYLCQLIPTTCNQQQNPSTSAPTQNANLSPATVTSVPTAAPSVKHTNTPTSSPTQTPITSSTTDTLHPTLNPTSQPTSHPTSNPSIIATLNPTTNVKKDKPNYVVMSDYVSPVYRPIGPVVSFRGMPRFGLTNNITDIFASDGTIDFDKVTEYAMGSILVAAFLLATYLIFIAAVVILKLCFGKTAGILAGWPFIEDKSLIFDKPRKNQFFRTFLMIFILIVIIGGSIFLIQGTTQLKRAFNDVRDGTKGINTISTEVVETANDMILFGETSVPLRDSLVGLIGEGICSSFEGGNQNPVEEIDVIAEALVEVLNDLQNFAANDVTTVRDIFANDVKKISYGIGNTTDSTEILANPAYYGGPTLAVGLLLLFGLIIAWLEITIPYFFFIQTWVTMPLFLIIITISIAAIAVLTAFLVASSDFCIGNPQGTPEGTVDTVLNLYNFDVETMSALDYYIIDGCRGSFSQLAAIEDMLKQLNEGTNTARDLQQLISINKEDFETYCGGGSGSLDPLQEALSLTIDAFDDVMEIGNSTINVLSCYEINSIWIDIVHEAACTSAPSAFTWMFSSIMIVYISGIVVYFLRGALLPSVDINDYEDESVYSEDDDYY